MGAIVDRFQLQLQESTCFRARHPAYKTVILEDNTVYIKENLFRTFLLPYYIQHTILRS